MIFIFIPRNGKGIFFRASFSNIPKFPGELIPYTEGSLKMQILIFFFLITNNFQIIILILHNL